MRKKETSKDSEIKVRLPRYDVSFRDNTNINVCNTVIYYEGQVPGMPELYDKSRDGKVVSGYQPAHLLKTTNPQKYIHPPSPASP
jgi:hypothetical protein